MAYPVSDRFKVAIRNSYQLAVKVELLQLGEVVATLAGTVTEGQVTEDFDQDVRRDANLTIVDETGSLTPKEAGDLLSPFGTEFKPYRGIAYPDGTTEYVPQGVFGLTTNDIIDTGPSLTLRMDGKDRSEAIRRNKFRDTLVIPVGTDTSDAILLVLEAIGAGYDTHLAPAVSMTTTQLIYTTGDDPWKALIDIAAACACEVLFDVDGAIVQQPLPSLQQEGSDWTISEGDEGTMLSIERRMERNDDLANRIIVTGQGTGQQTVVPTGIAEDDNPSSATYIDGPYGIVTRHVVDFAVSDDNMAASRAQFELDKSLGRTEEINCTLIPNPAMQVHDLVTINREVVKMSNVAVLLDQVSQPLVAMRGGQAISRRRAI